MAFKLLFPIETAVRELPYKLVLSAKFAQAGYECYLGAKGQINRLFEEVSPFAYFDKGYHPGVSEQIYKKIKAHGGLIINLDEEGGVDFEDNSTLSHRYDDTVFNKCDLIFLWGQRQYDFLQHTKSTFREDKVVVSGHPRFDLLKPQFRALYENDVKSLKKRYGEYILVCTNMGFGNNIRGDDFVRSNYGDRIHRIEEMIAFDKLKVSAYVSVGKRLSFELSCKIVIRPHPEERKETYTNALKGLRNVSVIHENSVVPWIIACKTMIHPDCTTGIESAMLGKLPISFLPGDPAKNARLTTLPVKLSHRFQNEDELIGFLTTTESNNKFNDAQINRLLNDFFSFQKNSTNLVVKSVLAMLAGWDVSNNYNRQMFYDFRRSKRLRSALRKLYHRLRGSDASKLMDNKRRGLNKDAIEAIMCNAKLILNLDDRAILTKIDEDLYRLAVN